MIFDLARRRVSNEDSRVFMFYSDYFGFGTALVLQRSTALSVVFLLVFCVWQAGCLSEAQTWSKLAGNNSGDLSSIWTQNVDYFPCYLS